MGNAGVAQLVEQRIRNAKVGCSIPLTGTISSSLTGRQEALAKAEGFFVIRCSHPDVSRGSFAAAAGKPLSFRVAGIRTVTVFIVSRRTV